MLAKRPIDWADSINRSEDYVLVSIQRGQDGRHTRRRQEVDYTYLVLSKNQRLTWLSYKTDARSGCCGSVAFNVYWVDIHFYFDYVSASFNGVQRILDFQNRTSDSGLYDRSGNLLLFAIPGDPSADVGPVFTNGTMADLLVTRTASGLFSAYVNGNLAFSVMDTTGSTRFSGPGNIMY